MATKTCIVALKVRRPDGTVTPETVTAPAAWVGTVLAVTPPPGQDHRFTVVRGQWTVTHKVCGLAAAHLRCSKADAVALARAWDARFASLDPANAKVWEHRASWGLALAAVNGIGLGWQWASTVPTTPADGGSCETAMLLAAQAGCAIDQGGTVGKIRWRGEFWPAPSDAELDRWTFDSVCETPDGRTVEPDHPESWLRILRLV